MSLETLDDSPAAQTGFIQRVVNSRL